MEEKCNQMHLSYSEELKVLNSKVINQASEIESLQQLLEKSVKDVSSSVLHINFLI